MRADASEGFKPKRAHAAFAGGSSGTSKKRSRWSLSGLLLHLVLILGSIVMVFPFLWTVSSSLKDIGQIFMIPPAWVPDPFVWSNYINTLKAMPFDIAYFNSFYISIVVVAVSLLTCSLAAYAFAKIRFPGAGVLFILFLSMMMIPKQVTIVSLYVVIQKLGWVDSHLSIIMPAAFFNAFGVFLLRQFVMGIPRDLEEAAIMDGANPLRIYWNVILPLVRSALVAFGIFAFKDIWNQFLDPLIFLSTPERFTVPLMLNMFKGLYVADWALMMAGTAISVIPVLVVYVIAQRHIIEGIALTGIKG